MLSAIRTDAGQKTYAFDAEKRHHYTCPDCTDLVSLKPGNDFAHRSGSTCTYRGGESEEHRRLKQSIFQHLKDQWSNSLSFIDLEYRLNDRSRPDIFLQTKRGAQIAIEVQLSALSVPEISYRTRCLSEASVYVLWIIPFEVNRFLCRCTRTNEIATRPKVKLKEQELFMFHAYYNKLIMWNEHSKPSFVVSVMQDYWTDGADFYDTDKGSEVSYAPRRTKLTKEPTQLYQSIQFDELIPKRYNAFDVKARGYQVPKRLVLTFDERKTSRPYINRPDCPSIYEDL